MEGAWHAACTISSMNYLAHSLTLAKSFLATNKGCEFHILLVDRKDETLSIADQSIVLHWVEDLPIPDLYSYAFRYDILEFNTNVKPSFLKYLLQSYSKVLYFDPDICVYQAVDSLYRELDNYSVLITPHTTVPLDDWRRPSEIDMLKLGVFNLGFIGVRDDQNSRALLDWWERRCLDLGYNDVESGLFVDQKWAILFPCLFEGVHIEKFRGYNVAYWNLQERYVSWSGQNWTINGSEPLVFYHFSGFDLNNMETISKHLARFGFDDFPELRRLFSEYAEAVQFNGHEKYRTIPYGFESFSNGKGISSVARRLYSHWNNNKEDPFSTDSAFYHFCAKENLLTRIGSGVFTYYTKHSGRSDWRIDTINWGLRRLLRLLGADRYALLNRYFRYISVLRNQRFLIEGALQDPPKYGH